MAESIIVKELSPEEAQDILSDHVLSEMGLFGTFWVTTTFNIEDGNIQSLTLRMSKSREVLEGG